MTTTPLIIIGAGRSGTNALRDALTGIDEFHSWPCDEINYIWRYGNRERLDDEFERQDAVGRPAAYIRSAFERRARTEPHSVLVEKTCANSLRVEFVDEVLPEARFVHIMRDGRDVTSSAMSRWTASLDLPYIARKARFVPPTDLPYYATRYIKSHLDRRRNDDGKLSTWGPRFAGMRELVRSGAELDVVCAEQWRACVTRAIDGLATVPSARVHTIGYSDFTADPMAHLRAIVDFAGAAVSDSAIRTAASTVHAQSDGAWKSRLSPDAIERITPIIAPVHERIGLPD